LNSSDSNCSGWTSSFHAAYVTLAVRLGHGGLFTTGRAEMWRNAAVFTARAGGKCGLFLHEFTKGARRFGFNAKAQRRGDAAW
jgi:hypothetical protein